MPALRKVKEPVRQAARRGETSVAFSNASPLARRARLRPDWVPCFRPVP